VGEEENKSKILTKKRKAGRRARTKVSKQFLEK